MNIYKKLNDAFGNRTANLIVVLFRAFLMMMILILSDKGFTSFTYLQLNR